MAGGDARPVMAVALQERFAVRDADPLGARLSREELIEAKRLGMAAARKWRDSRRCHCGALAYQPCAHRPHDVRPRAARRHAVIECMPFANHRTVAEVWQDEATRGILHGLGR